MCRYFRRRLLADVNAQTLTGIQHLPSPATCLQRLAFSLKAEISQRERDCRDIDECDPILAFLNPQGRNGGCGEEGGCSGRNLIFVTGPIVSLNLLGLVADGKSARIVITSAADIVEVGGRQHKAD